jgi:hypothetical protein
VADVYWYFKQWEQAKVTEVMLAALREQARVQQGRNPQPSAGIIDSQSVKGADTVGRDSRGYDAGKKINGRKRFIVTDTLGLLIVVVVLAASVQDRDGARTTLLSAYLEERPVSLGAIDKRFFYVKTHFRHERRRLPRPDRAG